MGREEGGGFGGGEGGFVDVQQGKGEEGGGEERNVLGEVIVLGYLVVKDGEGLGYVEVELFVRREGLKVKVEVVRDD